MQQEGTEYYYNTGCLKKHRLMLQAESQVTPLLHASKFQVAPLDSTIYMIYCSYGTEEY